MLILPILTVVLPLSRTSMRIYTGTSHVLIGCRSVQNPVELSVRNGVSYTMRHFIDIVAGADQATPECEEMFLRVLLPGLKIVLHSENEIVWMEAVGIFFGFF